MSVVNDSVSFAYYIRWGIITTAKLCSDLPILPLYTILFIIFTNGTYDTTFYLLLISFDMLLLLKNSICTFKLSILFSSY